MGRQISNTFFGVEPMRFVRKFVVLRPGESLRSRVLDEVATLAGRLGGHVQPWTKLDDRVGAKCHVYARVHTDKALPPLWVETKPTFAWWAAVPADMEYEEAVLAREHFVRAVQLQGV